jgi:diguanylate cyclase (GGDEF)-like protein
MSKKVSRALLLLAWAVLAVLSAALLLNVQAQGEADLEQRFDGRAEVAASFTATFARDLLEQERRVAERELSGAGAGSADLKEVTNLFGYEAAVLLDAKGLALGVEPPKRSLIGQDLTKTYAHLSAAAQGRTAVSKVVPSAARGIPIVAFATPFDSERGRRVFSGAFDVDETPIGAYLRNASPIRGTDVYLLDEAGTIVASNRSYSRGLTKVSKADPELERGLAHSPAGETQDGQYFASHDVAGAPWRLVMSVPEAQLLEPVQGFGRYVPWILWAGFVLGALACVLLVANLIASRVQLSLANHNLDRLARIDDLTDLYNRRHLQDSLNAAVANAERHGQELSVMMIDVDRFKQLNDTYGHDAGDHALRVIAADVHGALRAGDLLGRWGGEEFLAILPLTDADEAMHVAERVRESISSLAVVLSDQLVPVSASIGVAARSGGGPDELVAAADSAMYAAKAAGRDAVRS